LIRTRVPHPQPVRPRVLLALVVLAAIVFGITSIPYIEAYGRTPPGMTFGGVLIWPEDQGAYASFIRQAADGHFLFVNRLTSLEHDAAFFDLEWYLVGRVMALFRGSTDWAFQIWRAAGAVSVVLGFYALTRVVLEGAFLRCVALSMGLFGGSFLVVSLGFNDLSEAAEKLTGVHVPRISAAFPYFAAHPFAQILVNPHFALPLGIFMLAIAAFVHGERTGRGRWYAWAGVLALIEASMRPYEMIALYTMIPLFIVVEIAVARRAGRAIDWRRVRLRALPLILVAPVFGYTIYIFELHPIFRYWASQGVDDPISVPSAVAHMGLAGPLLAVRLCWLKRFPLHAPAERLLLIWMATVFFFIHSNAIPFLSFMPYTPQLITSLMPSVILLGVVVLDPSRWEWSAARPVLARALCLVFVAVNALDSVVLLQRMSRPGGSESSKYYIPSTEMEAFAWLDRNAAQEDVVLCVEETGYRLPKYASVRVVCGHWSVTPHFAQMEERVERFFARAMSARTAAELLRECRVSWVYFGPNERRWGPANMDGIPGFTKHVVNDDVTVYSADR
jgi:hypothetical protein